MIKYKTCTRSDILYDKGFIIHRFIQGLNCNFDHRKKFLDEGVLPWYELPLNEVLISVNCINLNKQSIETWINAPAKAHATGKQGAMRPPTNTTDSSPDFTITIDPNVPAYLYKSFELTQKAVKQLVERYLYPLSFIYADENPLEHRNFLPPWH